MKKSNITFQQLDMVLRSSNFDKGIGVNAFGIQHLHYENTEYDAIILVPSGAAGEYVSALDIHSAERTMEGRGVMSREMFFKLLRESGDNRKQAA